MDPLTHGLTGALIRQAAFRRPGVSALIVISALLPDIDYATRILGADMLLAEHRGITHGIAALFVVPSMLAYLFGGRGLGYLYYYAASFMGYGSHVLMDTLTLYGSRILSPLDNTYYSLPILFIIDPVLILILLWGVWASLKSPNRQRLIAVLAVVAAVIYCMHHNTQRERAREFMASERPAMIVKSISPMPNSQKRWWVVLQDQKGGAATGIADLLTGRFYVHDTFPPSAEDEYVKATRKNRLVRDFLNFAKYPYAVSMRTPEGAEVRMRDLAFSFIPGDHFTARVSMDASGSINTQEFSF